MKFRLASIAIMVAIIAVVVIVQMRPRLYGTCDAARGYRDTEPVQLNEAQTFLKSAAALQKVVDPSHRRLPLRQRVEVSGTLAALHVRGPMKVGDLRYAQIWQEVYASYHDGKVVCVRLRLRWATGELDQEFPINPNFL